MKNRAYFLAGLLQRHLDLEDREMIVWKFRQCMHEWWWELKATGQIDAHGSSKV
jgi:hypothetical protein